MAVDGHGTVGHFGDGFSANIIDINGPSAEKAFIDTTHMGTTTAMSFIPATLYDPGSIDLTCEYNGEGPINDTAATSMSIVWANGSTATFDGFVTGCGNPSVSIGERMTFTVTIKVTGPISVA